MKRNRKLVSILLTLALLATLLVPMATPAGAAGLSVNYVDKTVNLSDTATEGDFGNLIIKETTDFVDVFVTGTPVYVTFTLVDGVEFQTGTKAPSAAVVPGAGVVPNPVATSTTSTSVTYEVYGSNSGVDKLTVDFGTLKIDGDFTGEVKVDVSSLDSSVTSGQYVIGYVSGDKNTVAALSTKDVTVGDTAASTGTVRITESSAGNMAAGEITVTLPDGVKFDKTTPFIPGGTLAGIVSTNAYHAINNPTGWTLNSDKDELTIHNGASAGGTRGFLDLTFNIDVDYDCTAGDITVEIEGDSDNNIQDTDVVLGTVEDFGVSLAVDEVKNVAAGQWAKELGEVKIKQNTSTSLVNNRYITMEITNAKFTYKDENDNVPDDTGLTVTDASDSKITYKLTSNTYDEYTIEKLKIGTLMGATGDVTIKFSGNAGVSGDLVVAKLYSPITATVENAKELKIGVQAQPAGDILVKEGKAEAIKEEGKKAAVSSPDAYKSSDWTDDTAPQILLETVEGLSFAARPTAEVVEGDLKLDDNNLVYLKDANGDGLYEQCYVVIDKNSSTASTVKFSNIKLNVSRYVPEGSALVRVKGNAIVDPRSALANNASTAANAIVGTVVTPAPQEESSGMFIINSGFYNQNGVMKMMDVAPYIKGDRTYVPVRYLAYVCGLSDSGIVWDDATQTVTLTKGATVVKLVMGSKTLTVGDKTVEMDVAPENFNGRTMLPARYVAEAFGGTVTWNAASQTVGIQF